MQGNGRGRRKGSGARAGAGAPRGLRVVQALSDPSRWRAMELLFESERTVGELAGALGLSVACTSHHVSILKEVGVLHMHRAGKSMRCSLAEAGSTIGDLVRSIRSMPVDVRYVSNSNEDIHRSTRAYAPSAGAVPEFEPSRR